MAERKSSSSTGATYSGEASRAGSTSTSGSAGDITGRTSSATGSGTPSGTAMRSSSDTERTGMVDRMKDRASAQINSQKDRATDGLGTMAQAVRQSTQQLRDQQHETVAGYVEQAAEQIERLSQRLKQKDVGELLRDAQQLARRKPALFVGSAFALGVIGARFLKSSPPDEERYGGYGAGGASGSGYSGGYRESTPGRADYQRTLPSSETSRTGSSTQSSPPTTAYRSNTENR